MPDSSRPSIRSRLKARVAGLGERALDAVTHSPLAAVAQKASERSAAMVLERLGDRIESVADVVASRLLSMDELASALAFFTEQAAAKAGRDALLPIILRRNLMLDGTFLRLLEPLLTGQSTEHFTLSAVDRRRALQTLSWLIHDLATAAGWVDSPATSEVQLNAALQTLADSEHGVSLGALLAVLEGRAGDEETDRFIVFSYLVFLQSHLLRSVASMTTDLARARATLLLEGRAAPESSDP
jgi:hypothetical protein